MEYVSIDEHDKNDDSSDINDEQCLLKLSSCVLTDTYKISSNLDQNLLDSLTILYINIRSMNSNFVSLRAFIYQIKVVVKIIIITETHTDETTVGLYNLHGYKKAYMNRDSFGGGLIAFIHNSLEFNIDMRKSGVTEKYETLLFTLKCPESIPLSINFLCVYVPHRQYITEFVQYLKNMPRIFFRKNLLIVGDLNLCPLRDIKTNEYCSLFHFLSTKNFDQFIKYPTFFFLPEESLNSRSHLVKFRDEIKVLCFQNPHIRSYSDPDYF